MSRIATEQDMGAAMRTSVMGRKPKYPWELWLDGRNHVLVYGEDFSIKPLHMRMGILQAARVRGIRVSVRQISDEELVIIAQD